MSRDTPVSGRSPSGRAGHEPSQQAVSAVPVTIANAARTSGLAVVDPFARQILRQRDGAVMFVAPDDSAISLEETLENLDRVSALWNTFCGIDEPAALMSELIAALAQYRDDLRRPPNADSIERRVEMITNLISRLPIGHAR